VLAPDLIRVRASFAKPIPARDHSWAIAKESWNTPQWTLNQSVDSLTLTTEEIETVVQRSPLLISFRDARTHELINADERPMMYDAKGTLTGIMFDPKAGMFVAAAKKLGFDEHFSGWAKRPRDSISVADHLLTGTPTRLGTARERIRSIRRSLSTLV